MKGKFDLIQRFQKQFVIKVVLVAVLVVVSVLLVYTNQGLVKENKKMIKFINNEEVFRQNLEGLQKSEEEFGKYMLKLENGTDLEKVKADHINQLLNMVKASNLKVDSYRSEIEKKDGFVIFKYNVTIVGRFVQALPFFARVRE
ncbi:MAG: hypothetical protein GY940_17550, partial [bacterium]|nr:hypothetical protein [bacterium]